MKNQTRNTVLVLCAVAITSAICFKVISDELGKRKATKVVESPSTDITDELKNVDADFSNDDINQEKLKNDELIETNEFLSNRVIEAEEELRSLKEKFAVQLEAERQKANIIWSDGTSKPKYNKVQEGIDWSDK